MTTVSDIKSLLIQRVEEICLTLLPGGKRMSQEWCVGSLAGEPGSSLRIHLGSDHPGVWSDFSNPEERGDLIDLWCKVRGVDFVTGLKQIKSYLNINDVSEKSFVPASRNNRVYLKPSIDVIEPLQSGGPVYDYLTKERRLDPSVLQRYKIGQMNSSSHGPSMIFPCYDPEARGVDLIKFLAVKRDDGKKIIWASANSKPRLFGWQGIDPDARNVVITEGEIDALTIAGWGHAALSVPQGAVNMEWIEHDFDSLSRFEKIYICTDDDEPGRKAASEIVDRLGRERCYRLKFDGCKDANQALTSGRFEECDFYSMIGEAKTMDPVELCNAGDFGEQAWEFIHPTDKKMSGTLPPIDMPYRIRHGEVTIWSGFSGHGKSLALNQFLINDANQGEKVFVCSLEIPVGKTVSILTRMALGYCPELDKKQDFDAAVAWLSDKIWLFNRMGATHWSKILPVMEYAARRYGCTRFGIDSLLFCGVAEDDYEAQKEFIAALTAFAAKYGHVHIVCHSKKREDESKPPGKMDVRGSGAITDMVHNGFTVWRNKDKERAVEEFMMSPECGDAFKRAALDALRDGQISMWKNREDGSEPFRSLWLHKGSGQFAITHKPFAKRYIQ